MRTVVIMEHDGTGYKAMPIAVLQVEDADQDWRVKDWLERNGWSDIYTPEGSAWSKFVPGIYGGERRFAGISEPIFVTEVN